MSISANYPALRPALLLDFANSQQLDPRVTFSRSTTAPYYDGKTSALAEQNLQVYSQAIGGTGWSLNQISANLNNAVAPDGTTTMSQLVENVTTANHYVNLASGISFTSGLSYTISVYMQIGVGATAPSIMQVWANNFVATAYANFNISTNAVANTNNCTAVISQVGSSTIYRCSITITATSTTSTTNLGIAFTNNNSALGFVPSYLGVATSDVKVWGFQVEQRSSVTAYNATTTSALTNYIPQLLTAPINAPRFDFNPTTGESLGLLIEQSSTNLLLQSQFASVWTNTNTTSTQSANIAPDGTQTAIKLVENSGLAYHNIQQTVSASNPIVSVYAKAGERSQIAFFVGGASIGVGFNLLTGATTSISGYTAGSSTTSITAVGNGWYRCSMTFTGSVTFVQIGIGSGGAGNYTGDGYSGIYIWGAQLEALPFPTSYIFTTSAQVTRASDKAVILNVSGIYNATQGTILTQGTQNSSFGQNYPLASFSDGSLTNKLYIELYGAVTYGIVGNSATLTGQSVGAIKTPFKMALAAQTNDAQLCTNGTLNQSSSSLTMPPNISELDIGCFINFGSQIRTYNGCISKIAYYPIRVTNTQLQSLTGS